MKQDVVEIMKESLYDVFCDELGECDFGRSHGMRCFFQETFRSILSLRGSFSKSKISAAFMKALRSEVRREDKTVFSVQELYRVARSQSLQIDDFDSFIDNLNQQGLLLNKGRKNYQVVGVSGP
jgi:hypothetical protein